MRLAAIGTDNFVWLTVGDGFGAVGLDLWYFWQCKDHIDKFMTLNNETTLIEQIVYPISIKFLINVINLLDISWSCWLRTGGLASSFLFQMYHCSSVWAVTKNNDVTKKIKLYTVSVFDTL